MNDMTTPGSTIPVTSLATSQDDREDEDWTGDTAAFSDTRIQYVEELIPPAQLMRQLPISRKTAALVTQTRRDIHNIMTGTDPRLLVVLGPCSVHDVDAAFEYAQWLAGIKEQFSDTLLLVMRVYAEKPRTRVGWKGLINDPGLDGSHRINDGLRLTRQLLLDINALGIPTAVEFLDVITPQYLGDLVSWSAIGARTAESPLHRQLASGLSCPVGFKNGTSGNVDIAVNAVYAARNPHHFMSITPHGTATVVATQGNPDCHIVLRGGVETNYHAESVQGTSALLGKHGLCQRVMIDCGHGNNKGNQQQGLLVGQEIAEQLRQGERNILGVMVESNLVGGRQTYVPGTPLVYGQSITDWCIGLDDTLRLLELLAHPQSH